MDKTKFIKDAKERAQLEGKDFNPLILFSANGEVVATVTAPQCDQVLGIKAIRNAASFGVFDSFGIYLDSYSQYLENVDPFIRYAPRRNSFKVMKEMGDKSISESLLCLELDMNKKAIDGSNLLYEVKGKLISWISSPEGEEAFKHSEKSGKLYDKLNMIFADQNNGTAKATEEKIRNESAIFFKDLTNDYNNALNKYKTIRGILRYLESQGYATKLLLEEPKNESVSNDSLQ